MYGLLSELLSILARSYTNNLLEAARQMTLTAKPYLSSHLGQWLAGLDKPLGVTNTHTFQVSVGGHTHFGAKNTQQVVAAERDVFSQLGQADALGKTFINIVAYPLYGFLLITQSLFVRAYVSMPLDELG